MINMTSPPNPPSLAALLAQSPLFSGLTPAQLQALAAACHVMRYAPGTRPIQQNEPSGALYLILSGGGQWLRRDMDGVERNAGDVLPGMAVGEDALFFSDPPPYTLLIIRPSEALVLPRRAFELTLDAHPDIAPALRLRPEVAGRLEANRQRGVRADERILVFTRRHPWVIVGKLTLALIVGGLFLGLAIAFGRSDVASPFLSLACLGAAALFPALIGVYYVLEWANDTFAITDQRAIHDERSLLTFTERREQALLRQIQSVNVRRNGFFSEVLNFGDLVINTAGAPQPVILDRIPNPYRAQQVIFDLLKRRGLTPGQPPPPPAPPPTPRTSGNVLIDIFRTLIPRIRTVEGDQIVYRRHWLVLVRNLWRPTLFYLLLAILLSVWFSGRLPLLATVPPSLVVIASLVWLAINTFWWYWEYADWRDDLFILDTLFVVDVKRRPLWLQEVRIQAGLSQVQNVTSKIKGIIDRLWNKGDVIIQTAAEQGVMRFEDITHPQQVAEEVLQRVQRYQEMRANAARDDQRRMIDDYIRNQGPR
jgi:CRP-like cAMP-binding protein